MFQIVKLLLLSKLMEIWQSSDEKNW